MDTGSMPTNPLGVEETSVFTPDGAVRTPSLHTIGGFGLGNIIAERYVITEKLGQGGCGFVYAAHDRQLDVAVALKTLRPDVHLSEDVVAELKSEILMARRVTHANVCRIFDFGIHNGESGVVCFMTMELIRGETLGERIARKGRLPITEVAPIAEQVLAALDAAHLAGVVHADLKPANILLTKTDEGTTRAVVTDFGLATAHTSDVEDESKVTFGTPAYMAPEQIEGRALKPHTDYYALGCTLFHAISGRYPFPGDNAYEMAVARLEETPPKLNQVVEVSGKWVDIVFGLMAREEEARLSSAEIRKTLDPAPRRRKLQIAAAAVIAAGLAAAAVVGLTWKDNPERLPFSEPDNAQALAHLEAAERLINLRQRDKAIPDLEKARSLAADHPRIFARLAEATFSPREPQRALDLVARAIEGAPDTDERDFYRAIKLRLEGKYEPAADLLTRLASKYPTDVRIGVDLIAIQIERGLNDLAAKVLESLEPIDDVEAMQLRAARLEVLIHGQAFEAARDHAEESREAAVRARMMGFAARFKATEANARRNLGDLDRAVALAEEAKAEATELERPAIILHANQTLVPVAMTRHDFVWARDLVAGERELYRRIGNESMREQTSIAFAEVLAATGDTADALAELALIIPMLRARKAHYWEAYSLALRAQIRTLRAEPQAATEDCQAAETIFDSINSQRLAAFALAQCANAYLALGKLEEAREATRASIAIREGRKLGFLVAQNNVTLASIELAAGNLDAAEAKAREAIEFFNTKEMANDAVTATIVLAEIAVEQGDLEAARSAVEAARRIRIGNGWELEISTEIAAAIVDVRSRRQVEAATARLEKSTKRARHGGYLDLALRGDWALVRGLESIGEAERAAKLRKKTLERAARHGVVLPDAG